MKRIISLFLIFTLFFSSCRWMTPADFVEEMKANVPEAAEFVEMYADELDMMIKLSESLTTCRFELSLSQIRVFDSEYNHILDEPIGQNSYLTKWESETVVALMDATQCESIHIAPNYVQVSYIGKPGDNTFLFIENKLYDFGESTNAYCEQINETWYAVIYYAPPG